MNSEKKALFEAAYKRFLDICTGKIPLEGNESVLDERISGFGTTIDEVIQSFNGFEKLVAAQNTAGSEVNIEVELERVRLDVSQDGQSLVCSEMGRFIVNFDGSEQIIPIRLSTMLIFNGTEWKVLHWHGSSPIMSENDTFHLNEWQQRTEKLEAEVKERTKELELRNQEAEIEVALERVRSRTMAMHRAEELSEVVEQVFAEFQNLNFNIIATDLLIFHPEEKNFDLWVSGIDGTEGPFKLADFDHKHHINTINAWKKGQSYRTTELSENLFTSYFESVFDPEKGLKNVTTETKNQLLSLGKIYHTEAFTKHGCIRVASLEAISERQATIQQRFSQVFNQTYTRFLDLQKAEEQTRQALIEAALERVRGMAMAMNHSDDINQIAEAIFNELGILNVNPLRVGVGIIDEKDESIQTWTSTIRKEQPVTISGNIPIAIHPMLRAGFNAWKESNERFIYELKGNEKESFYNRLSQTEYSIFEEHYKVNPEKPHFWCNVIFRTGFLFFVIDHEPEETDLSLLERFGDVFQLAYTRFEDLQKVEEQTKESLRKASLDRVRAEISSMRNSEDLEQITPLIWEELSTLDVPFFRCGIFIMDEPKQLIHTYLSKPDGQSLAVLNLPYSSSKLAKNSIASWRKGDVYTEVWDQDQFLNWVHSLSDSHYIDSEEEYQGSEDAPEKLALHFLPFKQGMLYVGSKDSLNEDQIETAQSLANAFEVAYARYEDFQQLEKTLHKLETTQDQLVQQEKLASLGQLTAGIAHEIKNPLNFVNNFSELSEELVHELLESIEKGDLEDVADIASDISQNLKKIYEHGSRADQIVKSMLQHSRYGNNSRQQTNLNSLIKEFVNLTFHGMRAGDHPINVDIEFNFDNTIHELSLVAEDFSRVVVNLCNNAFDAMRDKMTANQEKPTEEDYKPKLTLRTYKKDDSIALEVEDNGFGIPEDIKDKIMQPFFTTKKGTDGTGLGLSITNDIIMAHGGKLEVESKENQYTLFRVYLT
ncbi:MAG: hypothetical protein BalsKO_21890 [Balneolaceae bacterium]